jgi:molecular chaperone GrpE
MDTNKNNTDKEQNNEAQTDTNAENNAENSENKSENEVETLKKQVAELNDRYLRTYSEFDNYRKRTIKERAELIKTASEEVFKAILPVLDDLERAIKANETVNEAAPIKDGMHLIYNKLKSNCLQKGLSPFETTGQVFDADVMEAITHIPAPSDGQKGKVVDEIEKGYKLGDKVIRFAKVVVGN